MDHELRLRIANEDDIVIARQSARELAKEIGFGAVDQSRIATAVSELARNVVRYATDGTGEAIIRRLEDSPYRIGVEVVVQDEGPGIADVDLVMGEGFTTGRGMGLGLPGARRLMDELRIDSALGQGTMVTVRKWRR